MPEICIPCEIIPFELLTVQKEYQKSFPRHFFILFPEVQLCVLQEYTSLCSESRPQLVEYYHMSLLLHVPPEQSVSRSVWKKMIKVALLVPVLQCV